MRHLVEVRDKSGLEEEKKKSGTIRRATTRKTVQVEVCVAISWVSFEILILKVQENEIKNKQTRKKSRLSK